MDPQIKISLNKIFVQGQEVLTVERREMEELEVNLNERNVEIGTLLCLLKARAV